MSVFPSANDKLKTRRGKSARVVEFGAQDGALRRAGWYCVAHAAANSSMPQSAAVVAKTSNSYLRSDVAKRWLRMSNTSNGPSGFNRRQFLQGAVLTGAAALTAERLSGQGHPESSPASGSSLIRPAAPGAPEDPQLGPPDKQPPALNVTTREQQVGWRLWVSGS